MEDLNGVPTVVKSSCVFMSVPVSHDQATVLDIRSDHGHQLKVHVRYTNALDAFSDVSRGQYLNICVCVWGGGGGEGRGGVSV